jgi:3-hydroxybutyryl-CoA dehydrogenase
LDYVGGIAQVIASYGMKVALIDTNLAACQKAVEGIKASLDRLASKGSLSDEPSTIMDRLQTTTEIEAVSHSDFIIEAVPENEKLKASILTHVDRLAPSHALIATNTSSISITRLAAATCRPEQVIGMHFMNPVPIMQLVEVIKGMATNQTTFKTTLDLAAKLGKETCVSTDRPGFIVNRLLMPMINEAFYVLMEGVGRAEDIDLGMRLGTNQKMGPLALADFIGLDTCLSIMRVLHEHLGDDKYRPCPLLSQHVDAGWLGRKTGRGVYAYENI